jgi:uncharacterized membrane protein
MVKDYNFGKFMSRIYSFIASIFAITLIILGVIIIINRKTKKGEIVVETTSTNKLTTSPASTKGTKIVKEIETKEDNTTGIILIIVGILILLIAWLWVYFTHKNKDLQNVQGIGVEKDITF